MEKKIEVATIQANCELVNGYRLYWFMSKTQLEFIMQDVEVIHSPPFTAMAQYQEKILPVISLENHFGLEEKNRSRSKKYMVLKAANVNQVMIRLIVETEFLVKMQKLEQNLAHFGGLALPRNNVDILGTYALSETEVAIVPDIAGVSRSLKLRGDIALQ